MAKSITKPSKKAVRKSKVGAPPDALARQSDGRKKRGQEIANQLRNRIIRGELKHGEHMPSEAELMQEFAISRPTLREALRMLESDSLITIRRGARGGPVVHLPDPGIVAYHAGLFLQTQNATLQDTYEARLLIEPGAIRLLIEEGNPDAPDILLDILEQEEMALRNLGPLTVGKPASHFRRALIALTNSPTLILLMGVIDNLYEKQLHSINRQTVTDLAAGAERSLAAHRKLIKLVRARKVDQAVAHWRTHLEDEIAWVRSNTQAERVIDVLR